MLRRPAAPNQPTALDVQIGQQLRKRRVQTQLTQTALARELGVTFQQIQKYEAGSNRIAASRLWEIAGILKCEIADLFQEPAPDPPSGAQVRVSVTSRSLTDLYGELSPASRMVVARVVRTLHEKEQA